MYGNPMLFPQNSGEVKSKISDHLSSTDGVKDYIFGSNGEENEIVERVNRQYLLFFILAFILIIWLLKLLVKTVF